MGKKKYIKPEIMYSPLEGILLLDTISVDPTIQGNQEDAEIGAWNWEDEFTWPHTPLVWDEYD